MAANAIPDAIPSPELEAKLAEDGKKPVPLKSEQEAAAPYGSLGENTVTWATSTPGFAETALKAKKILMEVSPHLQS